MSRSCPGSCSQAAACGPAPGHKASDSRWQQLHGRLRQLLCSQVPGSWRPRGSMLALGHSWHQAWPLDMHGLCRTKADTAAARPVALQSPAPSEMLLPTEQVAHGLSAAAQAGAAAEGRHASSAARDP